jgi:hypothetical protein
LSPQQYTVEDTERPHAKEVPAAISENDTPPATATGLEELTVSPRPRVPNRLAPQQYAAPPVVTPHAKTAPAPPAARCVKVRPPVTGTGTVEGALDPVPNWPTDPFPQQ